MLPICTGLLGKVPVAFEQADYFVKEGADKTVNLTVVAGVDHSFGFTVQIRTADGTATGGHLMPAKCWELS